MASKTAIYGGLLSGLGKGMTEQALAKREEALERARQLREDKRRKEDKQDAIDRDDKQREENKNLLHTTKTDKDGNVVGITRGGKTVKTELTTATGSADDKRIWSIAVDRHTTKGLNGEKTDWAAVSETLNQQNRPDLAAIAAPKSTEQSKIDINSPEYLEAEAQAEKWAEDQAGWFSTDKSDFSNAGGNRSEAIRQKTIEIYNEMTGMGGGQMPGGAGTQDSTPKPAVPEQRRDESKPAEKAQDGKKASKPPGSGSQASPYRATSQAEIDWFKQNAAPGAFLEANGKLYRK